MEKSLHTVRGIWFNLFTAAKWLFDKICHQTNISQHKDKSRVRTQGREREREREREERVGPANLWTKLLSRSECAGDGEWPCIVEIIYSQRRWPLEITFAEKWNWNRWYIYKNKRQNGWIRLRSFKKNNKKGVTVHNVRGLPSPYRWWRTGAF